MKSLVVCNKELNLHLEGCKSVHQCKINGQTIHYSLIDVNEPIFNPQDQKNAVLVQKKAFSCNYRELANILFSYNKIVNSDNIQYYSIGSEFSGVVVDIGDNVKNVSIGDRVIPNGEYPHTINLNTRPGLPTNHASAEFEIFDSYKLIAIPDAMSDEVAAAFTIGAQTTYSMVEKLDVRAGCRVLITGISSNTSLFTINALQDKGVEICGIARNRNHVDRLASLGVKNIFIINGNEATLLEIPEIMEYIIKNGKFDFIIDPFADYYFFKVIDLMNICGKYISCGISNQFSQQKTEINSNDIFAKIIMGNLSIFGNCLGTTKNLQTAIFDHSNKKLNVVLDSVIEKDICLFFEKSFISKLRFGKVVFKY